MTRHFDIQGTIRRLMSSDNGVLCIEVPAIAYTNSHAPLLRYYAKKFMPPDQQDWRLTIVERPRREKVLLVLILN